MAVRITKVYTRTGDKGETGLVGGERQIKKIEQLIDECQKDLQPLKSFVLPGGGKIGAYLHQCRTVCRRAEQEILRLSRTEELSEWPVKYVNRLSDLFFVRS